MNNQIPVQHFPRKLSEPGEMLTIGSLVSWVGQFLRRRYLLILTIAATVLAAALLYSLFATPLYTARALLIIDTKGARQFSDDKQVFTDTTKDSTFVDSQVEILRSEQIIQTVAEKLKLADRPDFQRIGILRKIASSVLPASMMSQNNLEAEESKRRRAIEIFKGRLDVDRVGLSYVIAIQFTSEDRQLAANVANGVAEAFIEDQLAVRFSLSQDAMQWMQSRLEELRNQTMTADRKVQTFKTEKGIINTEKGLINEQQLTEMNTRLMAARQKTIETEAKLARVLEIMDEPEKIGSIPDELNNDVIVNLREQFASLSKRYQDLKTKLGTKHEATKKVGNELNSLSGVIRNELSRISEAMQSEKDIVSSSEKSLLQQMDQLQATWNVTNADLVTMRELETTSKSYHTLYETMLQRFVNTSQQQSFPITESRVITRASAPIDRSSPKRQLILFGAIVGGLMLGTAVAALRDSVNTVFRTAEAIEEELGLRCLGVLMHVSRPRGKAGKSQGQNIVSGKDGSQIANVSLPASVPRLASIVQQEPFSSYAETLRAVKVDLDLMAAGNACTVIGFTSTLASEGKSSTSLNMALFNVQAGKRVLLVDCDLRRPTMTDWLGLKTEKGLIHILTGQVPWREALQSGAQPSFDFIPSGIRTSVANTSDFMGSEAMANLLRDLRGHYDVILLDLPPIAPVPDVAAISAHVDMFLLLVSWGRTPINAVKQSMSGNPQIASRVAGVVLSDATPREMKRYGGSGSYSKYYQYN